MARLRTPPPALQFLLWFGLAFVPLALLAWRHTVDVPNFDQLSPRIVDLIEQAGSGRVSWATLIENHNEHLLLVTKLVVMANARWADGWQVLDSWVSAALIALSTALFCRHAQRLGGWLPAIAALLVVASLNQWRSVTWSFNLQHGVVLAATMGMALESGQARVRAWRLAALAAVGVLGSGNGLLLLAIGPALLAAQAWRTRARGDRLQLLAGLAFSVLVAALYAVNLKHKLDAAKILPQTLVLNDSLLHKFALALANPLAPLIGSSTGRVAVGALVLALGLALLLLQLRAELTRQDERARRLRPLAVVVALCLGSALMVALRREGEMLIDPKYSTSINPLYAGLVLAIGAWFPSRHGQFVVRGTSVGLAALFVGVSLQSLPAAALTDRLDRANAVTNFVDTAATGRAGVVPGRGVRSDATPAQVASAFGRLDRLGLIRPGLAAFERALQQALERLQHDRDTGAAATVAAGIKTEPRSMFPYAFDAIGAPGTDGQNRPADALLAVVLPQRGPAVVSVFAVSKTAQRNFDGSWWDPLSFSQVSERVETGLDAAQIDRVALLAVWLTPLRFKPLASWRPTGPMPP